MSLLHRDDSLTPTLSRKLLPPPWPEVTSQRPADLRPAANVLRIVGPDGEASKSVLALIAPSARSAPDRERLSRPHTFASEPANEPTARSSLRRANVESRLKLTRSVRGSSVSVEAAPAVEPRTVEIDEHNSSAGDRRTSELLDSLEARLRELSSQLTARIDDQVARVQFRNALFGP